jgi:hypothetical protein
MWNGCLFIFWNNKIIVFDALGDMYSIYATGIPGSFFQIQILKKHDLANKNEQSNFISEMESYS